MVQAGGNTLRADTTDLLIVFEKGRTARAVMDSINAPIYKKGNKTDFKGY
jgi:hypothetical protein